jgi:O-antigen/teichoic acid export membrane protein
MAFCNFCATRAARRDSMTHPGGLNTDLMLKHANRNDIIWGYAAQLLNVGAGVLLLPFCLRFLNSGELGLWYVFIALAGLAQLLEFGFQPTIARQTAYVYSGAQALTSVGLPRNEAGALRLPLLADLVAAARNVYRLVAFGAAGVLYFLGTFYLYSLLDRSVDATAVLLSWIVYATGALTNFYYGYFNGLLQGRGEQTAANKMVAISRGCMVVLSLPLLACGAGLAGLAAASLASAVVSRVLIKRTFFCPARSETAYLRQNKGDPKALTLMLWKSAWRMGVVQLGAFMILRANLFIATSYLGLRAAASYGLSLQLLGLLASMSTLLFTLQMPKMNALQTQAKSDELKTLFASALIASWVIYIVGASVLLSAAGPMLGILKSNTSLLPAPWLAVLVLIMFLEMNHALSAMYITTINQVPFAAAAVLSGVAIIGLGATLLHYTDLGIGALIIAQGLVQLAYNNWKWPFIACRHLQLNVASFCRYGKSGLARFFLPI